jgi:apolipoprotein N-acyltransferase
VTYSFLLASALVVLWTARILPIMRTGLMPEDYAGLTTLGSQALDLGILVPLSIATGVELIKKSPLGYYLCSIAMAVGLMMFISIPSWIAIPLIQDGKTNVFEAAPFFVLSIVGIALAITYYFAVQREEAHAISR